jgi:outer membrane protein OmpA-like peptidoglycan-associated protein
MKFTCTLFLLFNIVLSTNAQSIPPADGRKRVSFTTKKQIEFNPTISADGRTLIFETQKLDKWELYQSHLDEKNQWTAPYPLKAINEKCSFIAGPSLSYDGNRLYYTAFIEGVTTSEDIFYSDRLDDKQWSAPKSVGPIINSDSYEGFPSVSSDGNSIYFIGIHDELEGAKKEKEDCFAIYVSHRTKDGSWGEPELLPENINTGCERDPKIMADNRTLIFSSIQPGGQGKYDLYQSQMKPDKTWADPIRLDFINSKENDQSPCISASGDKMFFYSDDDIYEIVIPQTYRQFINITVQGITMAEKSKRPIQANIAVTNLNNGEKFTLSSNGNDGKYSIVLAAGQRYQAVFSHDEYFSEKIDLDFTKQESYKEEEVNVLLKSDYKMIAKIIDKDLHTPLTAFVTMLETGVQTIFSDSVKKETSQSFALQTNGKYQLTASAPGYPEVKIPMTPNTTSAEILQTIELSHAKVKAIVEVTDIKTGQKMKMKVAYNNETTPAEIIVANAGETVFLRKGDRYQVVTNSEAGYLYSIATIIATEGPNGEPQQLTMEVLELVEGAKLNLERINFKSNSADLNETSTLELKTIVGMLKSNPNIQIEISAHTDDVGTDDFNINLSQKRAQSVINYLSKNGVPLKQLIAKGYGESQPLAPNDSDENKAKNRRVELMVVSVK